MSEVLLEIKRHGRGNLVIESASITPVDLKEIIVALLQELIGLYVTGAKEKKIMGDSLDQPKKELAYHTIITQVFEEIYFRLLKVMELLKPKSDIIAPK